MKKMTDLLTWNQRKFLLCCILLPLWLFILQSCGGSGVQGNKKKPVAKQDSIPASLSGQWVLKQDMQDSIIKLTNKKTYMQDVFPYYNFIEFGKGGKLNLGMEGTFGCGTAAVERLNVDSLHFRMEDGLLYFAGFYTDHFGRHQMNHLYAYERRGDELILVRKR